MAQECLMSKFANLSDHRLKMHGKKFSSFKEYKQMIKSGKHPFLSPDSVIPLYTKILVQNKIMHVFFVFIAGLHKILLIHEFPNLICAKILFWDGKYLSRRFNHRMSLPVFHLHTSNV
mgnify:CR=1 FL=1